MRTEYKKMTSHGSVSIPVAMRRALDIEAKDPLMLEEKGGQIVITPYTRRCHFCSIFIFFVYILIEVMDEKIITVQNTSSCYYYVTFSLLK